MNGGVEKGINSERAAWLKALDGVPCDPYWDGLFARHPLRDNLYLLRLDKISAETYGLLGYEAHFIWARGLHQARVSAMSLLRERRASVEPDGQLSGLTLRFGGLLGTDGTFTLLELLDVYRVSQHHANLAVQ